MSGSKKRGGNRKGSGSPPLPKGEKKGHVSIFVKEKYIDAMGGKQACKKVAEEAVERAGKKKMRSPLFGGLI